MELADVYQSDDVALAALWLAGQDVPGLNVEPYIERLDVLGHARRGEIETIIDQDAAATLANFMAAGVPLRTGPAFHMHETMDTGCGLQMLCCGVWISVARRAGVEAFGLDVPGWFLARIEDTIFDVASGGVVLSEQ